MYFSHKFTVRFNTLIQILSSSESEEDVSFQDPFETFNKYQPPIEADDPFETFMKDQPHTCADVKLKKRRQMVMVHDNYIHVFVVCHCIIDKHSQCIYSGWVASDNYCMYNVIIN